MAATRRQVEVIDASDGEPRPREAAPFDTGGRGLALVERLADAWGAHIDDAYCSFNDIHAMLAFVGARHGPLAQQLEDRLLRSASAQ